VVLAQIQECLCTRWFTAGRINGVDRFAGQKRLYETKPDTPTRALDNRVNAAWK
jgi:hypothetical protein